MVEQTNEQFSVLHEQSFLSHYSDLFLFFFFCDVSMIELGNLYASRKLLLYFYNIRNSKTMVLVLFVLCEVVGYSRFERVLV